MPCVRKIVFYLFLLTYLLGCPFTILYVLGYVVRPGPERGLVKTGLISLSTMPPGASIYVGGKRYLRQTPTVLDGLYPDEYHLKVILKNHQPWIRTVRVEAEKAVALEKIMLLPEPLLTRPLVSDAVKELIPIPGTRFVVLATGPMLEDLVVYDREAEANWPLLPQASPFRGSQVLSHAVVRGSPFLLLRVKSQHGETYLGASLKSGQVQLANLTRLFPVKPQWVTWGPRWPRQLVSVQDGSVSRLDLEAMAIYPKIVERIRGVGVGEQMFYVLTEDLLLQRVDHEGRRAQVLVDDPPARTVLSQAQGLWHITALPDELLVLLGKQGELWVSRFPGQWLEGGVRGFEFDPDQQRLLIWQKDRVGILDCSAQESESDVAEPDLHPRWIVEEGTDIQQAFWVYDASHVLFLDGDTVFLREREPRDDRASIPLLRVRAHSAIVYAEDAGGLYYLDRISGALSFLELIPKVGR